MTIGKIGLTQNTYGKMNVLKNSQNKQAAFGSFKRTPPVERESGHETTRKLMEEFRLRPGFRQHDEELGIKPPDPFESGDSVTRRLSAELRAQHETERQSGEGIEIVPRIIKSFNKINIKKI